MNKEKNTKLIFKNNFYFLKKAFKFEPVYFITKLLFRIMIELRGAFLWVFLMQYVLSEFEKKTEPIIIINFLLVAFAISTSTVVIEHLLIKSISGLKTREFPKNCSWRYSIR